MKMSVLLTSLLTGFLTLAATTAQAVCFHDRASYDDVRTKLPPLMQKGSVTLVHDSKSLLAGVRIFPAGERFKLESHVWHAWMGLDQGEDTVREICYENGQARVVMLTGSKQDLTVKGQTVEIKGYAFKPGSLKEFRGVVSKIAEKADPGRKGPQ